MKKAALLLILSLFLVGQVMAFSSSSEGELDRSLPEVEEDNSTTGGLVTGNFFGDTPNIIEGTADYFSELTNALGDLI